MRFTGEFFVPGNSGVRIEADHMERYKFACNFVQGKSVLDIACGVGYSAPLLVKAGAVSYEGVDVNEMLISYAKSVYSSGKIKYWVGDICSFDAGKTYDVIVCYETIEHVADYESALKNLYRLLNHGGRLLISSPNRPVTSPGCLSIQDKPVNEFHAQEFTPDELLALLTKYNFAVGRYDVFGQRQRYTNRYIKKIISLICGNPNEKSSPTVVPVMKFKVPRYFIISATKQ